MKAKLIIFTSFVFLFIITAFLVRNNHTPITEQEVNNLSKAMDSVFQPTQQTQQTPPTPSTGESIMAIIYQKAGTTWFIKARGLTSLIDQHAAEFSHLFLDKMQFSEDGQPDFSHVPSNYQKASVQAMRVATFDLKGLEVSVTRLGGNQDVQANIQRWRRQLSLPQNAPEFVKFLDNKQTVLVRLDQQEQSKPAPQPPQKENMADFLKLNLGEQWQLVEADSGMASGTLMLNHQGQSFQVAVLRLPSSVPLETVLGIWKEKVGIPAEQSLATESLISDYQQNWQVFTMANQQMTILIAMFKGDSRYTFFRLSGGQTISDSARDEFNKLIKTTQVTKH